MVRGLLTSSIFAVGILIGTTFTQTSPTAPPTLVFEGNSRITDQELSKYFLNCSKGEWQTYDRQKYDYFREVCIRRFLWSKGFLKAVVGI